MIQLKNFLDSLADTLAGGITAVPGCASLDSGIPDHPKPADPAIRGDMQCHPPFTQCCDESGDVVALVGTLCTVSVVSESVDQQERRIALGGAGGMRQARLRTHNQ